MKYGGTLLGWKAEYTGCRSFDSRYTTFQALPPEGALAFIEFYDTGRRIITGGDWYFWDPKEQCIEYVPTGEWGTWKLEPKVDGCLSCVKKSGVANDEDWHNLVVYLRNARLD